MKKYWLYFSTAFRAESAYKADFLFSIIINLVYFFIYFTIWKTIYTNGGIDQISSYTLGSTITYYFISNLIFQTDPSNFIYLGWDIWEGNLTNDLIKPYSIKIIEILISLADVAINFLLYLPIAAAIIVIFYQYLQFPTALTFVYFIIAFLLSILLMLSIGLFLHSMNFFFGDQEANIGLANYIIFFFAGAFFPLAFLPQKIGAIINLLPFKYLFNTPINIFLGKMSHTEIMSSFAGALLWILIFYFAFNFLFNKGIKRYSGVGK